MSSGPGAADGADGGPLSEAEIGFEPLPVFRAWFDQALASGAPEPTAMALGTVGADGQPAVRMVLLKAYDERGLVFYTNYESRKARDLAHDVRAALTFFWPTLHRQVRVEGSVSRIAGAESDAYFASRDRGSRLGAWASPQSAVVKGRAEIELRVAQVERRFAGASEERWEFWQGRASRLHDRIRFRREGDSWRRERLAP
jgi:pyridoxamine 5'-phosphate oxidase